jgi:hypothetical protein
VSKTISNVLLVEDNPNNAELSEAALSRCGVCIALMDYQTAMATLPEILITPPDLVIFGMDRLSNAEFIYRLRQLAEWPIPLIVLVESIYLKSFVDSKCHARCACAWRPFSFGKLVFILPQLGLLIRDSIISDPAFDVNSVVATTVS